MQAMSRAPCGTNTFFCAFSLTKKFEQKKCHVNK